MTKGRYASSPLPKVPSIGSFDRRRVLQRWNPRSTKVAVRFQFLSSNGALTFAGALPALMKRQRHMKKALAISAVSGILMGTLAACGGAPEPPKAPSTDTAAPGAKASCSGATPATPATPGTPAAPTDPKAACSGKK